MTPWMQTFTGKRFDPFEPDPALIDIRDIAESLSNLCRFGGHSSRFYSVAEHSFWVGQHLWTKHRNDRLALAGLLHDATEAYLGDVPRPLKYRPEFAFYREVEAKLEAVIFHKFGINEFVSHPEIKRVDNAILADEAKWFMGNPGASWGLTEPPLGLHFFLHRPNRDWRDVFIERFEMWGAE